MKSSKRQPERERFHWWRWLLGSLLLIVGGLVIFWCLNSNWLDQKEADLWVQKTNRMANHDANRDGYTITNSPSWSVHQQSHPGTAYGDSSNQTGNIIPAQLNEAMAENINDGGGDEQYWG